MSPDQTTNLLREDRRRLIADVLLTSRLLGGVYMHAEYSAPWCMNSQLSMEAFAPFVPNAPAMIAYHYLLEGEISVQCGDEPPICLASEKLFFSPEAMPTSLVLTSPFRPCWGMMSSNHRPATACIQFAMAAAAKKRSSSAVSWLRCHGQQSGYPHIAGDDDHKI